METFEERVIKPDSFEEIDRILTIVETAKRDFNTAKSRLAYILIATVIGTLCLLIGGILLTGENSYIPARTHTFEEPVLYLIAGISLLALLFIFTRLVDQYKQNLSEYRLTVSQATEVIREITPGLARTENWSSLRKFEILLRLSKLGINTERIFEPGFTIP